MAFSLAEGYEGSKLGFREVLEIRIPRAERISFSCHALHFKFQIDYFTEQIAVIIIYIDEVANSSERGGDGLGIHVYCTIGRQRSVPNKSEVLFSESEF